MDPLPLSPVVDVNENINSVNDNSRRKGIDKGPHLTWVIGLILAILVISVLYISLKPTKPTQQISSGNITLTGAQIAEKTYGFLNTFVGKDNLPTKIYYCDQGCNKEDSEGIPQGIAWSTLADASMYHLTKDEKYKTILNFKSDYLMNSCAAESNKCWGTEIYSNIDSCMYTVVQLHNTYTITQRPDFKDFLSNVGDCASHDFSGFPMLDAIVARQTILIYSIETVESRGLQRHLYLNSLSNYWLNESEAHRSVASLYYVGKDFEFRQGDCWIQNAKLEFYRATKDPRYLDDVELFFRQVGLAEHLGQSSIPLMTAQDIAACTESLLDLHEITNRKEYADEAGSLTANLLSNYWDSPISPVYNGDGGFLTIGKENPRNQKKISDNAYVIYVLSRQQNTIFTIHNNGRVDVIK